MTVDELTGYQIVRKIPKGGLTDLYVCSDPEGKPVVARFIREQHKRDRALIHSFRKGIKILKTLDHPNIITMIESGARRLPYMIIEYHESQNMREALLHKETYLQEHALTFARKLASAVAYVHRQGYLHMDLKPENILVNAETDLCLIDFDFSLAHKPGRYVRLKKLPGTPTYLAPETLQEHKVDERSEVFTFGVVAYEMLSAHKPFESNTVTEYKRAVVNPRIAAHSLHDHCENISVKLEQLIMKCLQKDPEMRYPSMAIVKRDLDAML